MPQLPLLAGSLSALLAVILGAFGAHALKAKLSVDMLSAYETGVSYQMYHSLALLLTGLLLMQFGQSAYLSWAGRFFLLGIFLFSGSLYLLALTDMRWLGPVTPVGGLCFIIGWGLLAMAVIRHSTT